MRKLSKTLESRRSVDIKALYVSASSNKPSGKSSIKSKSLKVGDDFARSLLLAYFMEDYIHLNIQNIYRLIVKLVGILVMILLLSYLSFISRSLEIKFQMHFNI